jgi:hypothetical protein
MNVTRVLKFNNQNSELFTIEECDQAVMDFLAATEVGKFPPE